MAKASHYQDTIVLEEISRAYRTEIPNVVFEMLEAREITFLSFTLYCVYRRIAGEHGRCFVGTRRLAELTGMSTPSITKHKRLLSKPFKRLLGKSLIKIKDGDPKKEEASIITISDIWGENHRNFKNKLTCVKSDHGGVQNDDTGVCKTRPRKKEPIKKEPIEEESIARSVHKSEEAPAASKGGISPTAPFIAPHSSAPPPTSSPPAEGSNSFSYGKGELLSVSPELVELLELEPQYVAYFRPKIVAMWIKTYGPAKVLDMVKYFYHIKSVQKTPILNAEAWMVEALKNDYTKNKRNILNNKQFAEEMKQKHKCRALKINKRYCTNTETGDTAYYHMNPEIFQDLVRKYCQI